MLYKKILPGRDKVPVTLIADPAYPLLPYCMKEFANAKKNRNEKPYRMHVPLADLKPGGKSLTSKSTWDWSLSQTLCMPALYFMISVRNMGPVPKMLQ